MLARWSDISSATEGSLFLASLNFIMTDKIHDLRKSYRKISTNKAICAGGGIFFGLSFLYFATQLYQDFIALGDAVLTAFFTYGYIKEDSKQKEILAELSKLEVEIEKEEQPF